MVGISNPEIKEQIQVKVQERWIDARHPTYDIPNDRPDVSKVQHEAFKSQDSFGFQGPDTTMIRPDWFPLTDTKGKKH